MFDIVKGEQRRATRVAEIRAFMYCLNRSRFSVIILVIGLALLLTDQGQDLLNAYAEQGFWSTLRLAIGAAFWAVSIWAWCRLLLDIRYDDAPRCISCYNRWRSWMPRSLGSAAFLTLALAAYQSQLLTLVAIALVELGIFLGFVIWRRYASNQAAGLFRRVPEKYAMTSRIAARVAGSLEVDYITPDSTPPYENLQQALDIPKDGLFKLKSWGFPALLTLAMVAAFIVFLILGTFKPVPLGMVSGAVIIFFVWATTWLPVGSWMSYIADKHGWPLLTFLAFLAIVSSFFNDNHEIKRASDGSPVNQRLTVSAAMDKWAAANRVSTTEARPFVIVATAGGGIRAAYWTSTVLGELDRQNAGFRRSLFAISGVSGGSVGATVYRALIDVPPEQLKKMACGEVRDCAQKILGTDFLGPVTAAMLYPDLLQRFLPIAFLPDRGAALESGWEKAFLKNTGENKLRSSLANLSETRPWPALFLNATWSETGRRIIASNLRLSSQNEPEAASSFLRANDELAILGYDIQLSTAAHNSARFPFVSPPGMWRNSNGGIAGRLQDGGLFENFGAETALEILDLACWKFLCVPAPTNGEPESQCDKPCIYPVVVLISSDPSLPKRITDVSPAPPLKFGYEFLSTFTTFEHARSGHGVEAASQLEEWTHKHQGSFAYFRMCDARTAGVSPPLGWALSAAAEKRIKSYLLENQDGALEPPCFPENNAAAEKIKDMLSTSESSGSQ